jgi:hypothetical protein
MCLVINNVRGNGCQRGGRGPGIGRIAVSGEEEFTPDFIYGPDCNGWTAGVDPPFLVISEFTPQSAKADAVFFVKGGRTAKDVFNFGKFRGTCGLNLGEDLSGKGGCLIDYSPPVDNEIEPARKIAPIIA